MNLFKQGIVICGIIFTLVPTAATTKTVLLVILSIGYTTMRVAESMRHKHSELVAMSMDDYKVLKYYAAVESIYRFGFALTLGVLVFQLDLIWTAVIYESISLLLYYITKWLWGRNMTRIRKCVYLHVTSENC